MCIPCHTILLSFSNLLSLRKYRYRSINTESNAFKSKLAPLVGPVLLLKALGFVKNEEEGKFVLDG
jgi:hypothetical protein